MFVRQTDGAWKQLTEQALSASNRKEAIRKAVAPDEGGVFLVLRERDVPRPLTRRLEQQTIEAFD